LINIKNLKFSYPQQNFLTLDIEALEIKKNESIFIYGESGSGKSTFLEILAGVLTPQSGQLQIINQDLTKMTPTERDHFRAANIGYIFQSFNLLPYLNVEENIKLPLYLSSEKKSHENDFQELIQQLGLEKFIQRRVTDLSVGQQQRVAAARALLGRPQLILADEPTSALDYDHREKFLQALFDVCQKQQSTLLFVSHDRTLEKLFNRSLSFKSLNRVSK
jgi:putative ABC transport system ATP-binding protein